MRFSWDSPVSLPRKQQASLPSVSGLACTRRFTSVEVVPRFLTLIPERNMGVGFPPLWALLLLRWEVPTLDDRGGAGWPR